MPAMTTAAERRQLRIALIGAVALMLFGVLLGLLGERAYRERSVQQAGAQARILAASVTAALAFDDTAAVKEYVDALRVNDAIEAAGVYDERGVLLVEFARGKGARLPGRPGRARAEFVRDHVEIASPIAEGGVRLGTVYLRTARETLGERLGRHGNLTLLLLLAIGVMGLMTRTTAELRRRASDLAVANHALQVEMAERAKAEEALRQSQKMEALGHLTGGVAHDFNNLLTVIIGGLDTVRRLLPDGGAGKDSPRLQRGLDMALSSAQRAATLTKRLLAFSRRQPLEPKVLDANKMVQGMAELVQRTIGEAVRLETVLGAGLWRTLADPGQLENALLNLAVNARDAMPSGGRLTMETSNAHLDDAYVANLAEPVPAGQYVMLAVSDTGEGMAPELLERVFEPFFTTKEVGKGTGLGLSQVYGFVRQSGGYVRIYSEVGEGTTVKLYLPRALAEEPAEAAEAPGADHRLAGDERILVLEDHDDLRAYSTSILRELGYQVIEAADGREAVALLAANPAIDLLFTDVILPGGMNGRQVADEAVRRRPGLKVLFTTGYTRNAIVHNGTLDPGVHLISKPFAFAELAAKVRAVLDGD
ncbi:ATP-binding protein [Phenylobacterium sp.]|jgi:signal transduction histidine kinase|uniref:ATP-binding protein n=1 Tax=Phenylobacterium sp. TaxID=1871053 RepID=UPI003782FA57